MNKGITIKFPLTDSVNNFLFGVSKSSKDALKSKLLFLFYTEIGERYYMPDFGINMKQFLFNPNDDETQREIEQEFKTKVKKYIPEVTIGSFIYDDVEKNRDEKKILFTIPFLYREDTYSFSDKLIITFNNLQ